LIRTIRGAETTAWDVEEEMETRGRKPLAATQIIEAQMEAYCWLDRARDKLREVYVTMDRELWEAERELLRANGLVEGVSDDAR
jgi:hypothetical protein